MIFSLDFFYHRVMFAHIYYMRHDKLFFLAVYTDCCNIAGNRRAVGSDVQPVKDALAILKSLLKIYCGRPGRKASIRLIFGGKLKESFFKVFLVIYLEHCHACVVAVQHL
jgi:hypothetical protein